MPLTDTAIRKAKPADKPFKLADEKGLFLLVQPNGAKYWRHKYRFDGKEKILAHGVYPEIGLKEARKRRDTARKLLAEGVDPAEAKQAVKQNRIIAAANSFEAIARAWFDKYMGGKSQSHRERTLNRLETDIFPWIGKKPVNEIKPQDLLACLRRIEERGAIETAHRVRWSCSKVFRFAIASGIAENDPADLVKEALS